MKQRRRTAMRAGAVIGRDVDRLTYDVSERQPVVGQHFVHASRTEDRFDMHYGLEFGIVLSGRMGRHYAGHERELAAGDAWFCGMWETHGWQVTQAPCEVVVLVVWPPALAGQRFEESPECRLIAPFLAPPAGRPVTAPADRAALTALGRRLRTVITTPARPRAWLRLLAWEALLLLGEHWVKPPETAGLDDGCDIGRALGLVFGATRRIGLTEGAAACGLSRNAFAHHFQRATGLGFPTFALRCRLSHAARDLLADHSPLKVVAERWGFEDASHFCRLFRRTYGLTPAAYRHARRRPKT